MISQLIKTIVIFICIQHIYGGVSAQNSVIEFAESIHDFGQINESNGLVTHEFIFTNKGTSPLVIKDVKASCGCTTPSYTKDPIQPGKKGSIKAQFDPSNRPGVFDKTLTVTANSDPAMSFIKIQGFVIARVKTIVDLYPDTVGNLRMESRFLNVGNVTTKSPEVKEFKIYNEGNLPITFSNPIGLSSHLKFEITPKILPTKTAGTIKITYDAKAKNDFGNLFDNFILPTNDKKNPRKEISVVALVSEDFSSLSPEQKMNAPKVSLPKSTIDLGDVHAGDTVVTEFELINSGKSNLLIKKAKSTCSCISVEASVSILKPGETAKIKTRFNTTGRKGEEFKPIYIYTNDHTSPESVVNLKANVVK